MKIKLSMIIVFMGCVMIIAGNTSLVSAGDVVIIANKNIPHDNLSQEKINNIFLGKIMQWPNDDRIVIALNGNPEVHKAFLRKYIKRTTSQFISVWRQNLFTGKGRLPTKKSSDAELLGYVADTKGAVSYISVDAPLPEGVKILSK